MAWEVPHLNLNSGQRIGTGWADGILAARNDKMGRQRADQVLLGRKQAIEAARTPEGGVDWRKAVLGLYEAGDLQGAQSAASMAQNESNDQWRRDRAAVEDRQWQASHALDRQRVAQSGARRDTDTPEYRAQIARQNGLQEGTPEYQRYVLTGSLPTADRGVTAGDREAIRESDDMAQAAENTLTLFDRILGPSGTQGEGLADKAYDGWGAKQFAAFEANVPDFVVPDALTGGSKAQAEATLELDNTVMEQALGSMKQIFGGNPTEGERAVLLDLQGSANKPAAVRRQILERGRRLVERRLQYNRDKASELRGGDYYKPRGQTQRPQNSGPQPGMVEDGFRFKGGNPADPNAWEPVQ